jgi:hypothetical protein
MFTAIIGILVGGLVKVVVDYLERQRQSESTLVAIVSEVRTVCELVQHQQYFEAAQEQAAAIRQGNWTGESFVIDTRANYFSVYEALSTQLGLLKPAQITKIVSFYAYCKSAIDSTRPDGPLSLGATPKDAAGNIVALEGTLSAILVLGDEIAQLPKKPLPRALPE